MSNPTLFLYTGNGTLAAQDRSGSLTLTGSGAVRYAPASGARTNHILNPRFASATTGWSANGAGASISRVTDTSFSGGYGLEITGSTTNEGVGVNSQMRGVNLADGAAFTVSFDVYLVSGSGDWRVRTLELDAAGSQVSGTNGTTTAFTATSSLQRITVNTVVDVGATPGAHGILLYFRRASASAGTIRISNVVLESGTVTSPTYFDGSTGGVWLDPITGILGTAHASPSVSQAVAWVEEGTTNLLRNPSGENAALTGLANISSATVTRDSAYAYLGTYAVKIVTPGSVSGEGVNITSALSLGYTGSIKTFTASVYLRGAGSVNVYAFARYTDGTFENLAGTMRSTVSLTDAWVRTTPGSISTNSAKTVDYVAITVRTSGTEAATFYADAAQVEEKAYATSYADGSIGTGYAWTGTAHASSSTRTATTVTTDNANRINVTRGAYAIRALRQLDVVVDYRPLDIGSGGAGTDRIGAGISGGTDRFRIVTRSNSGSVLNTEAASPAIAVNTWYALFAEWSGTAVGAAVGTNVPTAGSRDAIQGTLNNGTTDFFIGSAISSAEQINGYIGPVLIADRPLTAKERATLSARTSWAWATLGGGGILRRGRVLATAGRR